LAGLAPLATSFYSIFQPPPASSLPVACIFWRCGQFFVLRPTGSASFFPQLVLDRMRYRLVGIWFNESRLPARVARCGEESAGILIDRRTSLVGLVPPQESSGIWALLTVSRSILLAVGLKNQRKVKIAQERIGSKQVRRYYNPIFGITVQGTFSGIIFKDSR